ncbi:MAG: hypothetical protein M3Q65_22960, partial [Chloroflexota bacterium]|nr:hypothetical protein [Chloroflexota bacterium]
MRRALRYPSVLLLLILTACGGTPGTPAPDIAPGAQAQATTAPSPSATPAPPPTATSAPTATAVPTNTAAPPTPTPSPTATPR